MEFMKYIIIGGDLRNVILANLLSEEGADVKTYALENTDMEKKAFECKNLNDAVSDADIIIGPLPCSCDDESLNTPFHHNKIYINDLYGIMDKKQIFIAGHISERVRQKSEFYNITLIDYLEREEMSVLNALPTAEGAIQIAMEEMPITLHDSKALVLGFGRIGKVLSKMLSGIGARVYVEARKYHDLAWISGYGYTPVHLNSLSNVVGDMDIIFNTIPHLILDDKKLSRIGTNTLIIDLASKPGGIDLEAAKMYSLKTIWALSLPGKVAPLTAARYIRKTIKNTLYELGV